MLRKTLMLPRVLHHTGVNKAVAGEQGDNATVYSTFRISFCSDKAAGS